MNNNTSVTNDTITIKCKCTCGKHFEPSYGEYARCPDCLSNQLEAAEKACGTE